MGDLADNFRKMTVTLVKRRLVSGILEGLIPRAAYVTVTSAAISFRTVAPVWP